MKKSFLSKNIFLPVFILIMAVNIYAGGGNQSQNSSVAVPGAVKKFSILNQCLADHSIPPDIDPNNNKWANIFKKELPDIDINWIIVEPNLYLEKQNVLVGSGDIPDVQIMTMTQMIQWSDQGIIRNIDGMYQTSYKNIYNFLTEDDLISTRYNNHTYGIKVPGNRLENPQMMYIRTDWLDRVNLPAPKTIDELYNVLKAFTFNDPDGNGQNDTYGLAGCYSGTAGFDYMWQIFSSFGVQQGENFTKVGNQIIPDFIRPEMRNAVEFLARLYSDGILDKDSLVMNGSQLEDKAVRGTIGLFGIYTNGLAARAYPNMLKANPNAKVAMFTPVPAPDGNIYTPVGRNGGRMYGISSRCNVPEAVLYFFNWMIEQDTSTLPYYTLNADKVYNGVLGVDTIPLGDKFILEKPQGTLSPEAFVDLYRYSYRTHMGTMQAVSDDILFQITQARVDQGLIDPIFLTCQQFASKYGKTNAVAVTGPVYAEYMNDISTYWQETIANIVTGSKPITAFDDFVKFFYANGGQKIIDEVTALNE